MALFFLTGLNGVGKTTISNSLAERNTGIKIVNGSKELMDRLSIPNNYEKLRDLPDSVKDQTFFDICNELSLSNEKVVITGHLLKVLDGKIHDSLGPWLKKCKKVILIKSSPDDILQRIIKDDNLGSRKHRRVFSNTMLSRKSKLVFLDKAQKLEFKILESLKNDHSIITSIVENNQGYLENTLNQVLNLINS